MPGIEGQPPTPQELIELRRRALEKINQVGKENFYPRDVEKIEKSDHYLTRFWLHVFDLTGEQTDEACHMIIETLRWRREFEVESVTQDTVQSSFFEKGILYSHNRDKDGKKLMVFYVGKHVRGQEKMDDLKKFFIYYLERLEREENGNAITIVFDCRKAGVRNMDMEFIQFIIGVFKDYYPEMLNYILVFEMPWVLNAAWKIIKGLLPAAAVKKIKFLNKENMGEYVDDENRLECWGGNDPWEYQFEPEVLTPTAVNSVAGQVNGQGHHMVNGNSGVEAIDDPNRFDDPNRKKVTFAEMAASQSTESISSYLTSGPDILKLTPSQEVVFLPTSKGDLLAKVMVQNVCDKLVGFKVKTTTPETYRVRPSSGVLAKGQESCVEMHMVKSYQPGSINKDKFLVYAIYVDEPDIPAAKLQELLKKTKPEKQYRLRCLFPGEVSSPTGSAPSGANFMTPQKLTSPQNIDESAKQMATLIKKINQLTEKHDELEQQLSLTSKLQILLVILSIILLVIVFIYLPSSPPSQEFDCGSCPDNVGEVSTHKPEL